MWAFKLLVFVSVVAVTLAGTPQWQNPRYSFNGHIPHFLPKAAPSPLFQFDLPASFRTGPTIDERGNTFFVRYDGVYHWSPVTNILTGPFLQFSLYTDNLQHAVISSDSKTLFVRWTNSTGAVVPPVTRGVPPENIAGVVALDVATMLAGSLSDTASVKWVWQGQVASDFIPNSYLSMWVEGDYVIVAYDRARVALIHANTGASLFDVDTATVTPLLYESEKYQDNRVFPHPDGVHFYWLRYDGILFRVNRVSQQVNFIDLASSYIDAWEYCTITTDATGSVIYGLNYANGYNETMFAIEPDLSAIRWVGNVADTQPAYGSGMLDIGDGLLALATDRSYEIVRASDGSSVGANFSVIYGSESTFLYNPTQRRLLSLSVNFLRTLHAISTSEFAKIEWTLEGEAGGGSAWDFSAPVAVDAAGRIIVTDKDAFYVFGCPFGQAVNATGDCSDTCPDGFMMEDNTCVPAPPVAPPVAAPSDAPVAAPSNAPVAVPVDGPVAGAAPVAVADDAPIGLPTGAASSVVPFASLAACFLALLSVF